MTREQPAITDEMRQLVGVESESWTVEIDRTAVRMFARAVGYTDRLFYDEAFAKSLGYRSLPCPPHFLGASVFDPSSSDPTASIPAWVRGRIRSPYQRLLNGGNDVQYLNHGPEDALCARDVLQATVVLANISERVGSIGPMLITVSETRYRRDGSLIAIMRDTLIWY